MSSYKNRFRNLLPLVAVLVAATLLGAPTQARANFQLSWSVNNTLIGSDNTNTLIAINTGPVGGFSVSGTALGTNSGAFAPNTAGMDLSTVTITSTGPSTLTLYLTQNNLTSPVGPGDLAETLTGHFITGSGSVSMVSYGNDTNGLYGNGASQAGTTPPTGGLTNVVTPSVGLGGSSSTAFNATSPYSITSIFTINFTSSGTVSLSSDGSTSFSNPAPSSLLLLLSGSPLCGLGYWLRRRKAAQPA